MKSVSGAEDIVREEPEKSGGIARGGVETKERL
jgi:hypothetical protein